MHIKSVHGAVFPHAVEEKIKRKCTLKQYVGLLQNCEYGHFFPHHKNCTVSIIIPDIVTKHNTECCCIMLIIDLEEYPVISMKKK